MKGKNKFTRQEANAIIQLIRQKVRADTDTQKKLRNKIRSLGFYASDFGIGGGYDERDFLRVVSITGSHQPDNKINNTFDYAKNPNTHNKGNRRDEDYILDLCDQLLKKVASRQHRFDFLKGDSGHRLPVDAYYEDLNLVIEYRERQHTEDVRFFNRRQTVSGVDRGEQRRIYDERRRQVLPAHGITLVELDYSDFDHDSSKRLLRRTTADLAVLKVKLKPFLETGNPG